MTQPHALSGTRILVTGAAGTIGAVTTAHLADLGALVTAMTLDGALVAGAHRCLAGDATVLADVDDALAEVDSVVHLAALAHRDAGSPYAVYSTNTVSTFTVLARAAERGVLRMVLASSINRYGLPQGNDPERLPPAWPLSTNTPAHLSDWYSLSKYTDEATAQMVSNRWGATTVALRFPMTGHAELLESAVRWQSENPRGSLTEGWSYLDVRDAARAIELSLTAQLEGAHAFYLAAPTTAVPYRTQDLIKRYSPDLPRARDFVGREVPIDLSDAEQLIGFRAQHVLDLPEQDLPF